MPRLPEENNVPRLDGRVEHVPGIEERSPVHVRNIPAPRVLGALQHLRPLNIGGGRGFDRFRDGEAAELLKLPGILGCHYKSFHGIAISFRYFRRRNRAASGQVFQCGTNATSSPGFSSSGRAHRPRRIAPSSVTKRSRPSPSMTNTGSRSTGIYFPSVVVIQSVGAPHPLQVLTAPPPSRQS